MQELLKLVAENPELPVVAMVDGEICWDDCRYWLGSFTRAEITELGLIGDRYYDDRDDFKEAYYDKYCEELDEKFNFNPVISAFGNYYTNEAIKTNEEAENGLEAYLDEMADKYMTKMIAVYVGPPDTNLLEA